ncbi:hypothetical protein UPYG_G00259480 [Umbra pygmaea]|uniref:Uncharacterized protein n=1 Tax=Umbra pygmaea TaxID=75934 RepID=A0ABD0W8V2_UMBPY
MEPTGQGLAEEDPEMKTVITHDLLFCSTDIKNFALPGTSEINSGGGSTKATKQAEVRVDRTCSSQTLRSSAVSVG